MSVTLTVSNKTFQKLKAAAKTNGKENVEQLLDEWNGTPEPPSENVLAERRPAVQG